MVFSNTSTQKLYICLYIYIYIYYKTRIFKELNNSTIYSFVTDIDNAIPSINNRIRDWMAHYTDEISSKLQNWIIDDNANFGYFYLNYKAHKPEKGYPGRMITSGCGSPTERLSLWCEYHLKPLMTLLPYRLEDTSHFIRKVLIYNEKASTENIPNNIILCSWDIEAMYPNITNDLGLTACKELLNKCDILEPSTDCIIDAIQITLEENIAKFGSTVAKQCDGTAMGPHHACSYADAAVDYAVDQKVMSLRMNPSYDKILDWSRFRDDIFCIWTGTEEELLDFNYWINNLHPRLKFTMEYSTTSIVFLDLRICTSGNLLSTEMYSKSSDTHAYLMPTSCHPTHVCRNIPKGVMKRVKRNCSSDLKCEEGFMEYKKYLAKRGYSNQLIEEAITEAKATPREQLIGLTQKNQDSSSGRQFPLVIKFNPKLPPMSKYIHKHNHILGLTSQTKKLFSKSSLFVSYRMEKNILGLITCNKFKECPFPPAVHLKPHDNLPHSSLDDPNWGCRPCLKTCTLCKNFLRTTNSFTSPKTTQTFRIKSHIDCNSKHVVYLVLDLKCDDIFYVGYTTDCMVVRWRNHKSHIKNSIKSCELASHFISLSSTTHKLDRTSQATFTSELSEHIAIILIESVKPSPSLDVESFLKERENFWQGALKSTPLFGGINKRSNKHKKKS